MSNKQKTHKGASKRFRVTRTGKVLHRSQFLRHLRSSKSKRQVRDLKHMKPLVNNLAKKVKQALAMA